MSPPELTCVTTLQGLFCGEGEDTGAHPGVGGAALPKAPPESFLDGVLMPHALGILGDFPRYTGHIFLEGSFISPAAWKRSSCKWNQIKMLRTLECKVHPNFKNKTQAFKDAGALGSCSDSPLTAAIQCSVMPYYKRSEKDIWGIKGCKAFSYLFGLKLDWTTLEIVNFWLFDRYLRISWNWIIRWEYSVQSKTQGNRNSSSRCGNEPALFLDHCLLNSCCVVDVALETTLSKEQKIPFQVIKRWKEKRG